RRSSRPRSRVWKRSSAMFIAARMASAWVENVRVEVFTSAIFSVTKAASDCTYDSLASVLSVNFCPATSTVTVRFTSPPIICRREKESMTAGAADDEVREAGGGGASRGGGGGGGRRGGRPTRPHRARGRAGGGRAGGSHE